MTDQHPITSCLIVDDQTHQCLALQAVIRHVLPTAAFTVANSLSDAVSLVRDKTDPIDLAVIDLRLGAGGEEGIQLIKTIRSQTHRCGTRVILITAYPAPDNRLIAEEAGADAYISKLSNCVTRDLQKVVKELVGR